MSNIKYDVKMIMSAFVDPLLRSRGWRSPRLCHGRVKVAKSIVYNLKLCFLQNELREAQEQGISTCAEISHLLPCRANPCVAARQQSSPESRWRFPPA